ASAEALLLVLRQLGAAVQKLADVEDALRQRRQALWQARLQPVAVAWDRGSSQASVELRLPAVLPARTLRCRLTLETGEESLWDSDLASLSVVNRDSVEGTGYLARSMPLPGSLPWGYHQLVVELEAESQECLLLSAPVQSYRSAESARGG